MNPEERYAKRQQILRIKQNLHLLSPSERRRARKDIADFEAKPAEPTNQSEHSIYYIASTKMLRDEKDSKCHCPVSISSPGSKKCREVTVVEEDMESLTEWLEAYGCSWQEQ